MQHLSSSRVMLHCRAGFNLLFYGAGSKRSMLNDFAQQALTDGALVVINAFLGQITAKQIVVAAASALSSQPDSTWRCARALQALVCVLHMHRGVSRSDSEHRSVISCGQDMH